MGQEEAREEAKEVAREKAQEEAREESRKEAQEVGQEEARGHGKFLQCRLKITLGNNTSYITFVSLSLENITSVLTLGVE